MQVREREREKGERLPKQMKNEAPLEKGLSKKSLVEQARLPGTWKEGIKNYWDKREKGKKEKVIHFFSSCAFCLALSLSEYLLYGRYVYVKASMILMSCILCFSILVFFFFYPADPRGIT